ncbi:translation elongation factor Ts [Rickettsiales bacterium]|nr:translation elongation factor Ts [Rickettsiales bacterium]
MADLALIKKLREITGCGIADCNKALANCNDDLDQSVDWLRKKGLSSAAKKSGRIAAEGVVAIKLNGNKASVIEVNAETDFVARNDKFQNLVNSLSDKSLEFGSDIDAFKNSPFNGETSIEEEIKNQIGVIGENINLRRIDSLSVNNGIVSGYIHNVVQENMGRIAVLVALESDADQDKLNELGKQIAMHIAATKPEALNIESVNQDKLDREIAVLKEQAKSSGKPENIIEKMMQGRIRKYYEEIVLLEQFFVMDDKVKIKDVIANTAKDLNSKIELTGYKLFVLGEGIEKKEEDFAAEVASMTNSN